MALKATVYKADLQISDMDRHYYANHSLTLAQHPSETNERLMLRVLAFALNADERLMFTRGLSETDEPDLWRLDLTGVIEQWIELGLPDEKRLRKASGRADQVIIYTYHGRPAVVWWEQMKSKVAGLTNLRVVNVDAAASQQLAALAERNMQLQCTIQDGEVWFGNAELLAAIPLVVWQGL